MRDRSDTLTATDALLLLMALIWGVNYSAVKYGGHALTPLLFTWARVLGASITLLAAALIQRKLEGTTWPARRDAIALLALGVIGNGLYQLCFVFGVARTRVADAVLIVASAPAIIALISRIRGIERLRARVITGIAITIVGVGIVLVGSATHATTQPHGTLLGVVLISAGVIFWSVYTVAVQPYTTRVEPVQLNALTMIGGFIPLLFLSPMALDTPLVHHAPSLAWWCLLYSSVVSLGVAYLFWYRGIKVLGPTRTAAYSNLQPVVAILTGWILLGETPTVVQAVGTVTIIGGIFLARA